MLEFFLFNNSSNFGSKFRWNIFTGGWTDNKPVLVRNISWVRQIAKRDTSVPKNYSTASDTWNSNVHILAILHPDDAVLYHDAKRVKSVKECTGSSLL